MQPVLRVSAMQPTLLRPLSTAVSSKRYMKPIKTKQDGVDILHDPLWNKGMAMDYPERDRLKYVGRSRSSDLWILAQPCLRALPSTARY